MNELLPFLQYVFFRFHPIPLHFAVVVQSYFPSMLYSMDVATGWVIFRLLFCLMNHFRNEKE